MSYTCKTCGKTHTGLPDIGFQYPDHYFAVPEAEREHRIQYNPDFCNIDGEQFFIRGVILIPIINTEASFGLGEWVSQKKENFYTYLKNDDTAAIGPFFGWLCNNIPFYQEETQLLKTKVHFQGNGQRPFIEVGPAEHPLYQDSIAGLSLDEAWKIAHGYNPDI